MPCPTHDFSDPALINIPGSCAAASRSPYLLGQPPQCKYHHPPRPVGDSWCLTKRKPRTVSEGEGSGPRPRRLASRCSGETGHRRRAGLGQSQIQLCLSVHCLLFLCSETMARRIRGAWPRITGDLGPSITKEEILWSCGGVRNVAAPMAGSGGRCIQLILSETSRGQSDSNMRRFTPPL